MVQRLRQELHNVEIQLALLGNVWRWYILPLMLGQLIWISTIMISRLSQDGTPWASTLGKFFIVSVVLGCIAWWIGRLNRTAVETSLEPYHRTIVATLREVENGTDRPVNPGRTG